MRTAAAGAWPAIALALLLASAAHAVDPRARSAPLDTAGDVASVAVSDAGTIVAAADDPGSSVAVGPDDPGADEPTWYAWAPAGTGLQSGSSDMDTCGTSRLGDVCKTPAVAAAVSGDGKRFIIGANPADSPLDNVRGVLVFGLTASGEKVRVPVANPIQMIATDQVGKYVAVVERVTGLDGSVTSVVEAFAFDGNAVASVFSGFAIDAPATSLAVNRPGTRAIVGADTTYRFLFTGVSGLALGDRPGDVNSVAVGSVGVGLIVAGLSTGEVTMSHDNTALGVTFSQKPGAAVHSVAVQPMATKPLVVAGDAAGKLHVFRYDPDAATTGQLVRTIPVASAALLQTVFSSDGSTLAVRTPSEVHLFQSTGADLVPLWKDTVTSASVALSGNGDLVAAAVGQGIRVYDAVHAVAGKATPSTALPGQSHDVKVTYANTGTRLERATLSLDPPSGWTASVTPGELELEPGKSAEATVRINIPPTATPGLAELEVGHALASGGGGSTPLGVTVGVQVSVAVRADGPASVGINPGGTVLLKARVENRGNQELQTAVRVAMDPPGWAAVVTPQDITVPAGANRTVSITVTAAASAKEGDSGHLQVSTTAKPDEVLHMYATVGAKFAVAVSAPPVLAVGPGNQTELEVTVQNKGNTIDGFDVQALDVPVGWTAIFDGGGSLVEVLGLEPGEAGHLRLTLRAPDDAEPGQVFKIQVQALSQGKTDVHDERTIQVTVGEHAVPPEEGTPGPGLAILLAGLGAATLRQRSRSGRN